MKKFGMLVAALLVISCFAQAAEAGIFRKRNGEVRRPIRNSTHHVFGGGCAGGVCR